MVYFVGGGACVCGAGECCRPPHQGGACLQLVARTRSKRDGPSLTLLAPQPTTSHHSTAAPLPPLPPPTQIKNGRLQLEHTRTIRDNASKLQAQVSHAEEEMQEGDAKRQGLDAEIKVGL